MSGDEATVIPLDCERRGHPDEGDGVCACGLGMTVHADTIEAGNDTWRQLTQQQRDEIHAFTQRHLPGQRINAATYDVIDAPLLRIRYLVCEDGRHAQLKPGTDEIWMETVEVLLREPLPEWWEPR